MQPDDRIARRARQRARRRRRRLAFATLAIVLIGATALAVTHPWNRASPDGPSASARAAAGSTPGTTSTSTPPARTSRAEVPLGQRMPTIAEQRAAVARVARLGLPLFRAGGKGHWIALTFDDGPGPYTQTALDALKLNGARATFFLNGKNIAQWGSLAKRERRFGEVADHTWSHAYLPGLSASELNREIDDSGRAISRASGAPVLLLRPPYGARTATIDSEIRRRGLLQVQWTVDSRDSQGADWQEILRISKEGAKPGAIILLHENRGQTLKAVNRLLPWLKKRGLTPVSIPELLALDPPSLAQVRADARNIVGAGG